MNSDLWKDNELLPEVKEKLLEIVDKFLKGLEKHDINCKVNDIIIVGSNANYNYSENSDIDLHIVADTKAFGDAEKVAKAFLDVYRATFNDKYDITINGHEVEIYVEPNESTATSNGVYSLNTGWIKKPTKEDIPEVDLEPELSDWLMRTELLLDEPPIDESYETDLAILDVEKLGFKNISKANNKFIFEGLDNTNVQFDSVDDMKELVATAYELGINEALKSYSEYSEKENDLINQVESLGYKFVSDMSTNHKDIDYGVCLTFDNLKDTSTAGRKVFNSWAELENWLNDQDNSEYIVIPEELQTENLTADEETKLAEIDKVLDDIKLLRQTSILNGGEYSKGNLIFKELRNRGIISDLKAKKTRLQSKQLSL